MQVALTVNNSTPDQAPETTNESTSSIQQTNGEGLSAPSQPTSSTSAADQQQLMNLLRTEAASPDYSATTSVSAGHVFVQLGIGVLAIFLIVVLAIVCQRLLTALFTPPKKQNRPANRKKRAKR